MNNPIEHKDAQENTNAGAEDAAENAVRCPPGTTWDPGSKQCIPIKATLEEEPCPAGTVWDPQSQQCVPIKG